MSIDLHADGPVCTITINRPERMNALNLQHYQELSRAWTYFRDDPALRVAIITGAGDRAFCAGADLAEYTPHAPPLGELFLSQKDPLINRGLELWKPVVAAVNGYCIGGGMTLLLATDLRVASSAASFALSEVQRGLFPANGGTQRLLQQLPHAIAMEALLIGDRFDAERAERWGLVNAVVAPDQVMPKAMQYAQRLAQNAPLAVQAAKELAVRSRDVDLATGLRMEQAFLRLLQDSADVQEGSLAFRQKRKPAFRNQ